MYIYYNPNPMGKRVGDCSVRAISKALNVSWDDAYIVISEQGYKLGDMPSADYVWGSVLKQHGYTRHIIPNSCPNFYTTEMFCRDHPQGTYVLGFGNHVCTIVDGNIYDSWNSSEQVPVFYWRKR